MSSAMAGGPVTVLFTDLVRSTELLQRVGDEQAQRVLRAHHRLLRDAVAVHGGREVKWLGDGLMTTFAASADAVRCAVAMQQTTRVRAAGERLAMRAGLHVGEVLPDEADYVGSSVVVARRLCDRAAAGQILCSGLVVELLGGRRAFRFGEVGALELKGFAAPVAAYEVHYEQDDRAAVLRQTPFTGRAAELKRVEGRLEEAQGGRGGVVMVVGEPGIGKTRTMEEFTDTARAQGTLLLWGRCHEGEAGRPYGPFVEAIAEHARQAQPDSLQRDLGLGAAPLGRLVPTLRERLLDLPEPVALQPDEERTRLFDAVTRFLLALADRTPTVLVLDDLHWADVATVALLRYVARYAMRARLLIVGAYRDVEVGRPHPLGDALGTLPRETRYDLVKLVGLDAADVRELLGAVSDQEVPPAWTEAVASETSGNPFFIRELLFHLLEENARSQGSGLWTGPAPLEAMRLPETVRQVIERRLGRLSQAATALLRASSAFTGGIPFEVTCRVAGLDEPSALDALDETLDAQLLVSTATRETYDFTHALVRHTLYASLSPPRQVRLHRAIAEAMEAVWGERAMEHAAEIAEHYHRSASLPNAERGVSYCLAAADLANRNAAFADAAAQLRAALALLPASAPERLHPQARLGLALVWALRFEEATVVARDVAAGIAEAESREAAADYLAEIVAALDEAGGGSSIGPLTSQGLDYAGDRRDRAWAVLKAFAIINAEIRDPTGPGIPIETPERLEVGALITAVFGRSRVPQGIAYSFRRFASRADVLERDDPTRPFAAGEYRKWLARLLADGADNQRKGRIERAVGQFADASRLLTALGDFDRAQAMRRKAAELAERLPEPSQGTANLVGAEDEWRLAMDDEWDVPLPDVGPGLGNRALRKWYRAGVSAGIARTHAHMGRVEPAMRNLARALPAIERAAAWAPNYTRIACDAADTLWLTERNDWIDIIERNLRDKVIAPDFHYPMMDGRLALGRLCALQQRYDEAVDWFAKARTVLDDQAARPLRAIVDYDEALMFARRGEPGDAAQARPLLDAALAQFRSLGMPGWIRRAEALRERCDASAGGPAGGAR